MGMEPNVVFELGVGVCFRPPRETAILHLSRFKL
jgi:hypothetical protein